MPTTVFGLPTHVLVVHAVVVLLPAAAVAAALVAVWPSVRRRIGVLTLAFTFVATWTVPVATNTGEGLVPLVPASPLVSAHVTMGQTLVPLAALLGLSLFVVVALDVYQRAIAGVAAPASSSDLERWTVRTVAARTGTRPTPGWLRPVVLVAAVVVVVMALGSVVQIVRIGHSGAQAAWAGRLAQP